jgi:WD40 repeat protein/serine/threonine protein kinase
MNNLIGAVIQHYQILVKVRETPTRILFKAYDTKAQRATALEVVKETRGDTAALFDRLNAQAQENARLEHPGIAVVTDAGIHEGLIYLAYGFCPTHPFRRFFNRTYSWQETARELVSITHALAYAHEKGVWHGFLHPASIVLDDKKNPILFDFGFERLLSDHTLTHSPGAWVNRWGYEYQPPEQLSGGPTDRRGDIYAIGMMLHEWLVGKIPLVDSTYLGTLQARRNGEFKPQKKRRNKKKEQISLSPVAEQLIQKCIAKEPNRRYQSMQEVYVILARGALDMTITRRMVRKPLAITDRRMSAMRLIAALGVILLLAVTGLMFMNNRALSGVEPATPSAVSASVSPTPGPTSTPPPARPSATPQAANPATVIETPGFLAASLPLFQGDPISIVANTINKDNIDQMVMVSLWGIGEVNQVSASPDGKYLAAASSIGIFVLDAQSLDLVKYIDTRSWITTVAFSPDSRAIASGDRDGLIQLWHVDTWEEFDMPLSGHRQAILDLVFSPDGTKLASIALDNTLIQWQLDAPGAAGALRLALPGVSAVAYASDSTRIVTGGNDFKINIWSAGDLSLQQTVTYSAKIVDIASGANRVVVGGADQRISLLNLAETASLEPLGGLQYPLSSLAISPTGDAIAGGDINGGVTVWDGNNTLIWRSQNYVLGDSTAILTPGSPHSLAFSPDGKSVYSGLQNGAVRRLSAASGEEFAQNRSLNIRSKRLALSHNSQYALTQHDDNTLTVWDVWNAAPLYRVPGVIKEGDPFSQNDRMFAVASDADTVKIHEAASGRELYAFNNHRDLRIIQFTDNNTRLAAGYDQLIHLWSMASGQEMKIKKNYEGRGCATMYDLKEQPLFSITNYQYIVRRGQSEAVLCNFQKLNWTIAINDPQGRIAYGGNSKLTVVTERGEIREMLGVNRKNVVSVALNPAGNILAAAFDDNTIHFWDANTREELFSLFGHHDRILGLQFTPDGRLLISISEDGTIRVWGVPN